MVKNQDPGYDDIRGGTTKQIKESKSHVSYCAKDGLEPSAICTKSSKIEQTISRQEPAVSA